MDPRDFRYPEETVERKKPVNLSPQYNSLFQHELYKTLPPVAATGIVNAVVDSNGLCLTYTKGIPRPANLRPTTPTPRLQFLRALALLSKSTLTTFRRTPQARVRQGILLTDAYFNGFFHWYADTLPKLEALRQSEADLSDWEVLVPHNRWTNFSACTLEMYEVRHRIIKAGEAVAIDNLCIIPPLAATGNYRPSLMQGVRKRLHAVTSQKNTPLRCFISRRNAKKRRLTNEPQAIDLSRKYGYTPVVLEELTPLAQLSLVSRCESLAGLHGAGLTHMLTANNNATVLEIRGDNDRGNNCYFSLASALEYPYHYVPASPLQQYLPPHKADYKVCLHHLEAALDTADRQST